MAKTRARQTKAKKPQNAEDSDEDRDALGIAGEEQAKQELPTGLKLPPAGKEIARYLEIQRGLAWGKTHGARDATAPKEATAMVLQRRGDVQTPACERCQAQKGAAVFGACVGAPVFRGAAFLKGACANCVWEGKERSCSLRGTNVAMDEESMGQFVGDEEGLRAAMAAEENVEEEEEEEEAEEEEEEEVEDEVEAEEEEEEEEEEESHRVIQTVPSRSFFGAFKPDMAFARVGVSQRGPRCQFDGEELRFPITRDVWENSRLLVVARADLAHFVSIVDARLYELGSGENADYFFWQAEAKRMPGLYAFPPSDGNVTMPTNPRRINIIKRYNRISDYFPPPTLNKENTRPDPESEETVDGQRAARDHPKDAIVRRPGSPDPRSIKPPKRPRASSQQPSRAGTPGPIAPVPAQPKQSRQQPPRAGTPGPIAPVPAQLKQSRQQNTPTKQPGRKSGLYGPNPPIREGRLMALARGAERNEAAINAQMDETWAADLARLEEYRRYKDAEDGGFESGPDATVEKEGPAKRRAPDGEGEPPAKRACTESETDTETPESTPEKQQEKEQQKPEPTGVLGMLKRRVSLHR
ncbi:hypothetical protein BDV18DRAFT_164508 [Aspergillus unguis]